MSEPEVLFEIWNHVGAITLNRPAALNALSIDMIAELQTLFTRCAQDTKIRTILLRGAGGKAFSAGGDVRALYQSVRHSGSLHEKYFQAEYRLDYSLYSFPKPYIALLDGVAMGGGLGLAQSSRFRVVGERTRVAMPEVNIGLFPDVGASYFLSRLPGALGVYLGLTGARLGAADAIEAGLADFYLAPAAMSTMVDDLSLLEWTADPDADVLKHLQKYASKDFPAPSLRSLRPVIDAVFSRRSIAEILVSLDDIAGNEHVERVEWARDTAALMRSRSPTMLSVTLHQLKLARSMNLADCFRMELGMVLQCMQHGDFLEGVRALIIDKDNAPRWHPGNLDAVSSESVAAFFRNRWQDGTHPLADL